MKDAPAGGFEVVIELPFEQRDGVAAGHAAAPRPLGVTMPAG
jgi:hypothetical protein